MSAFFYALILWTDFMDWFYGLVSDAIASM